MRNLILILLLAISANAWSDNITRTYNISFQQSDFLFSFDANRNLQISTYKIHSFPEKNEPGLPVLPYEVTFDGQYSYVSSRVRYKKRLIKSNVIVQQSPVPVVSDPNAVVSSSNGVTYPESTFPNENLVYSAQSCWSDLSIFRFLICPFVYDATNKNLYFIDSFTIDITATNDDVETSRKLFGKMPSKMRKVYGQKEESTENENTTATEIDNNGDNANVEYVIITADSLRQAFEPLMNWKRAKGLKSKIISIEEIYSKYPGSRNTVKLKNCLYDLYLNKGLVYVLLGGDDTIVPVQGGFCQVYKGKDSYYTDASIPSDIFYSCFDGDFEWDGNKNGIYGEINDNINFTQYIYVTRVPVRTTIDASSFITKLLNYEQNPDWSNRMLMSGTKLWRMMKNSTQSDAEAKGDNLYRNHIKRYWNGERYRFYDTATDFAGGETYNLTNKNLAKQLSNGYDFVDMITHGGQTIWSMEEGPGYSSSNGMSQTNIRSSIVTTMACHTNAFDASSYPGSTDPCLSESLIRNPTSGVVAYLGSSRYGWGYGGDDKSGGSSTLGVSLQYESSFYDYLFKEEYRILNYGMLVSTAKNSFAGYCSSYGSYRWIQLALNPIGDPEMPIFIEQPKVFNNIEFEQTSNRLTIKTGVEECKICVMSAQDHGNSYHKLYDAIDNVTINQFPSSYSVCVTKQGYIPAVYHLSYESESNKWFIQNEKLSGKNTYTMENVEIGSCVTNMLPEGDVDVNSGTTEINAKSVLLQPGFSVKEGAEFLIKTNPN